MNEDSSNAGARIALEYRRPPDKPSALSVFINVVILLGVALVIVLLGFYLFMALMFRMATF